MHNDNDNNDNKSIAYMCYDHYISLPHIIIQYIIIIYPPTCWQPFFSPPGISADMHDDDARTRHGACPLKLNVLKFVAPLMQNTNKYPSHIKR